MVVLPLHASIGDITELNGVGKVIRDDTYSAVVDFDIQSYDDVRTSNGRLAITFEDESIVRLTEHSQLVIDEFVYDENPSNSRMALNFASGTARFITGSLGSIDKENIQLSTPTAQIGIRGTDFTVTVDELGRSLIILLPDEYGISSGEIVVTTLAGTVVLNKPYESTVTSVLESAPTKPVILDLSLDLIDNMLIVTPPKETNDGREDTGDSGTDGTERNILDIDYLNIGDIFIDELKADDLEFTELDINYLDVNFLEDLLDIIEEIDQLEATTETDTGFGTQIRGTNIGQDTETQITTLITGETVTLIRQVNNYLRLDLDSGTSYNIRIDDEGKTFNIIVGGGSGSTIRIKQSSG
tara:strand:+ start:2920 stop:3987 length:1068 start_codon:yes stop_codon:yes gene_type:complete